MPATKYSLIVRQTISGGNASTARFCWIRFIWQARAVEMVIVAVVVPAALVAVRIYGVMSVGNASFEERPVTLPTP